jgi:hypothetical protein
VAVRRAKDRRLDAQIVEHQLGGLALVARDAAGASPEQEHVLGCSRARGRRPRPVAGIEPRGAPRALARKLASAPTKLRRDQVRAPTCAARQSPRGAPEDGGRPTALAFGRHSPGS